MSKILYNNGHQMSIETNPLYGKKIIIIGDSMVYGNSIGSNSGNDRSWPKVLADMNGLQYVCNRDGQTAIEGGVVVNAGINGCMLSYNHAPFANDLENSVSYRYPNMDDDADYIIVYGGTNDGWSLSKGSASGQGSDLGEDDSTDNTTFNGAVNVLMQGLLTKYPKSKIGFITPYLKTGDTWIDKVITSIKNGSKRNGGIPVFDNSVNDGLCWSNEAQKTELTQGDNVHLNEEGLKWVATKYNNWIKSL